MRISRIYTEQSLHPDSDIELGKDAARHLVTVLRHKPGDPVCLFNGEGGEYPGEITAAGSKSVRVRTRTLCAEDRESPLRTLLGIGISRGERFEWVLQKATELGVSDIFPLYTERTEVKLRGEREDKKHARWRQVIVSACEQCGRNRLPELHPPRAFEPWVALGADLKLVFHHRSDLTMESLRQLQPGSVAMAIGPEGGLTDGEIATAQAAGFESLTLGPRVFRTETAPVAALSIFQSLWGDF